VAPNEKEVIGTSEVEMIVDWTYTCETVWFLRDTRIEDGSEIVVGDVQSMTRTFRSNWCPAGGGMVSDQENNMYDKYLFLRQKGQHLEYGGYVPPLHQLTLSS
jgi:hypothetical protein